MKKHQRSEKHSLKAKAVQFKKTIKDSFRQTDHVTQRIKAAEVRLAVFTAEHNIPFNVMNHLVQSIQKIGVDAEVVKKITCSRTKCSQLVKNVTGATGFQNVVQFLGESKFSIAVNEFTDISSTKHLVLLDRYFNGKSVTDEFLGLIPVADAEAVSFYNCRLLFVEFFVENEVLYRSNLIGFASDGASNMFRVNHSRAVLLTKDVPNIFTMKCICHSFALCANYACTILPRVIEDIARDVYNYLNNSFKRLEEYKEFQSLLNLKPHKMLQLSQTRWLSLLSAVKRLLEQYDALLAYFNKAAMTDKILAADTIAGRLKEGYVKLYLEFLEFVLPFFHNLKIEMQSEDPKLHVLYERVAAVFKSLVECFMYPDYLKRTESKDVNVTNAHNYLHLEEVYLGATVTAVLFQKKHNLNSDVILDFRKRCLGFLIEACRQIRQRFNFKDPHIRIIKMLSILDPSNLSSVSTTPHNSIAPLASRFPNLAKDN